MGIPGAGAAVLVKRGGCTFSEKAQAVDAAHAAALIVYNNDEGQQGRYLPEHSRLHAYAVMWPAHGRARLVIRRP